MIEDDLRAAFERHETLTPPTGPLRAAIDRVAAVRRHRLTRRLAGAAVALIAVASLPFAPNTTAALPAKNTMLPGAAPPSTGR